jgi:hypothetical protein
MRPLIIDGVARAEIAHVIDYAEENPYHEGDDVPGDNKNYVCLLGTYRCVFTYTHSKGKVYKHLSVSVPSSKYPNIAAALMIATEFGFTGWDGKTINRLPTDWRAMLNENEHCIVVIQEMKDETNTR